MSNQLDVIIPQILARGLATLRENIVMPFLVNRGYQAEAAQRGDTVTIPVPSAMSAVDVTTGITPGDPTDFITPSSVTIPLDKWKKSDFSLTDKDLVEIQEGYLPLQAEEAVKALANQVDSDLLGMANGFYGFSAVLGQPLAQMSDLVEARKVLNQQLAPMDPRYIVVGPQGEAEMLGIQAFHDASFGVGGEAILEGRIVRRLGFGIAMDQNVADLSQGDMTDATVSGEGSSLALTVNSGVAPSVGDIVEIASQAGTFVITSINGGNTAIEVAPAIAGTIDPGTPAGLTYPTEAPCRHELRGPHGLPPGRHGVRHPPAERWRRGSWDRRPLDQRPGVAPDPPPGDQPREQADPLVLGHPLRIRPHPPRAWRPHGWHQPRQPLI